MMLDFTCHNTQFDPFDVFVHKSDYKLAMGIIIRFYHNEADNIIPCLIVIS